MAGWAMAASSLLAKLRRVSGFLVHNMPSQQTPLLAVLALAFFLLWWLERRLPSSSWVPLLLIVWTLIKFERHQRKTLVEEMNLKRKWHMQNTLPLTPLEPCEWLNKLLINLWPNYMEPKLSHKFSAMLMKKLKAKLPKLIENIELQEFSLGLAPPGLGLQGSYWTMEGKEHVLHIGFEWDTSDMSILLAATVAGPIERLARIIINNLHLKGDLRIVPIPECHSLLYSFETTPEIHLGVAFGGDSESPPSLEVPGIASCLEKVVAGVLKKTMVEPHRSCFSFPAVDMKKRVSGAKISVMVVSIENLGASSSTSNSRFNKSDIPENESKGIMVEVKLEGVSKKTGFCSESVPSPQWDETFDLMLEGSTGSIYCNVYEQVSNQRVLNSLGHCKIKVKYVQDDSSVFWAIGKSNSALAKRSAHCGDQVTMSVPIEGNDTAELTVKLVVKEWHYVDGSTTEFPHHLLGSLSSFQAATGRNLKITVEQARNLAAKDKSGTSDPYVLLQYGKTLRRTKTVPQNLNPTWNQTFEFAEISGGEYLKLKCYDADLIFDDALGSSRVNLEGLKDDEEREIWIPFENMDTGEIKLIIKVTKARSNNDNYQNSTSTSGMIELVLVEARDLVAADLRGTSDPFVSVHYGKQKKRTKVIHKTLHPCWNQTIEFPDDGKILELHVKDHNIVLPTSNIGYCAVQYQSLLHNHTADMWIPLQGVRKGEIHVKVTRRLHQARKIVSEGAVTSNILISKISSKISGLVREARQLAEEAEYERVSEKIDEIETLEREQDMYISALIKEKESLLSKIDELDKAVGHMNMLV